MSLDEIPPLWLPADVFLQTCHQKGCMMLPPSTIRRGGSRWFLLTFQQRVAEVWFTRAVSVVISGTFPNMPQGVGINFRNNEVASNNTSEHWDKAAAPPPPQPPTQMLLVMLSILTEYYRVLVSSQCQCIFSKMGICSVDHWLGIIFLSVGYWVWLWFLSK